MTTATLLLVSVLRALPRVADVEVETGIGMMRETAEVPDGEFLRHADVEAAIAQYEATAVLSNDVRLASALRDALETIETVRTCAEYEGHSTVRDFDEASARAALADYEACTPAQSVNPWTDVHQGLPPAVDGITGQSERVLVATNEVSDGQTFAYLYHYDDEPPMWRTACRDGLELTRVTHYRRMLELPKGASVRYRSTAPISGVPVAVGA